ncbi:MAG TPA: hypothetical protein VKU61_12655 [Candidatus Binatia bacterium]|nr:hypothetical protein [Candidatus Binatia bacterium]
MLGRWKRIARNERGQDLAEYGIALGLVGAVAVAAALAMGMHVGLLWNGAESTISGVIDQGTNGHGNHGHHHGGGNSGNGGGNGAGH